MADFGSARAKLNRAAEHYEAFQAVLLPYLASQPVTLEERPRVDRTGDDYFVRVHQPLPPELNTIFGDCVHNLRTVLDHIVQTLAVANGGDANDRSTSFPICDTQGAFVNEATKRLRPLSDEGRAFIESCQPYNRQGRPWTLKQLRHLDDRDKHRAIIEHRFELTAFLQWTDQRVRIEYADDARLQDGTFYATVHYEPSYQGPKQPAPIIGTIGVQHWNTVGFVDAREFLRDEAFPYVRGILTAAERRFTGAAISVGSP